MKKIARPLIVLHSDRVLRERFRVIAADQQLDLLWVEGWDHLLDLVRSAPASSLIVVDPYAEADHRGRLSADLAALLHRFPSLAVTAAMAVVPGRLDDVRKLGEWGVVQIIDLEEDTTSILVAQRLLSVRGRPLRALIERALPKTVSGPARSILGTAVSVVAEGGQGRDLARVLHVTPRTLTRWCRRAGLPPPRRLFAWLRILLAAELLDDPGRTVGDVALSCGYAADSSLRLALRTFVGLNPGELRDRGAFETVSREFLTALVEAKSAKKRYRLPSRRTE